MNIRIPDAAFRSLDRMEPPEDNREEFTERHITDFIRDLATCNDPRDWLFCEGVNGEWDLPYNDDVAELLKSLALSSVAGHHLQQGSDKFWQVMKRMAIDRFEDQQANK